MRALESAKSTKIKVVECLAAFCCSNILSLWPAASPILEFLRCQSNPVQLALREFDVQIHLITTSGRHGGQFYW